MPTSLNDIASTCRNTVFLLILQYLNRRDDYENLKGVSQEIYTAMLALKKESPFAIKQLFSPSIDYDKLQACRDARDRLLPSLSIIDSQYATT
ncbi:hypothetical protein [Candidiatus Paracoxiella cheracis]|uniref:hypothetical protein n=1 Tax=Candidiatus Paracoxiella cheracis TaxID=3405120 RepID=UPI003BF5A3DB